MRSLLRAAHPNPNPNPSPSPNPNPNPNQVRSLLRAALSLPRALILNNKSAEDDQTATIRVWHAGTHTIPEPQPQPQPQP